MANAGSVQKEFKFHPVSHDELSKIIDSLSDKKTGMDGISSKEHIIDPLIHLINASLEQGVFPDSLKERRILPIFKIGDRETTENYRPISILNVISKIFEKVVLNRLLSHLEQINFICDEQHGFQKGKSTKSAIVSLVENLIDVIDSGDKDVAIFLDSSKAFDCVNHGTLLKILESVGVKGFVELKWFKSYLIGRKQCVELTTVVGSNVIKPKSDKLEVLAGVPQGSILGPFFLLYVDIHFIRLYTLYTLYTYTLYPLVICVYPLFLLYVDKLPKELNNGEAFLFADDTSLMFNNPVLDNLEIDAHVGVQSIVKFFNHLQLTINSRKCQYLQFKSKYNSNEDRTINVFLNDKQLHQEENVAFLGVLLDRQLSWNTYIEKICNKASSGVFYYDNSIKSYFLQLDMN